jgi:hypothetical protein
MPTEDNVQNQMLIELRKIAAQRAPRASKESGGYFHNFYVGVKGLTDAQIAIKNQILDEQAAKKKATAADEQQAKQSANASGQAKSMAGGMMQQALVMNPINELLAGFFEVFEPISDAFGALGEAIGPALQPIISSLAGVIIACMPWISEFATSLGQALTPLATFITKIVDAASALDKLSGAGNSFWDNFWAWLGAGAHNDSQLPAGNEGLMGTFEGTNPWDAPPPAP